MTDLTALIFWSALGIFVGTFFSRVRVALDKRGFRLGRVRYASLGVVLVAVLVTGLLNPSKSQPKAKYKVGQTYTVKRNGWVCASWNALAQSNDASLDKVEGFAETYAHERQIGCVSVSNGADDSVKMLQENSARALLWVRIISVHDSTNGRTGWVRARDIDDASATAAKLKAWAASKARDKKFEEESCTVEGSIMEAVAKGRDRGIPEATAHSRQGGDIDNKIITLIYQTPRFSPQQERKAVVAVCNRTGGFMHGVGLSTDANTDEIDASIIHSIKLQLLAHR